MSRSRAGSANVSISLFPFLAVLICTMGVLILMLVIAAWAADQKVAAERSSTEQEQSAQVDALNSELEISRLKSEAILRGRSQVEQRLDQSRLRRGHVEQDLRELEFQFQALQRQRSAITQDVSLDASTISADLDHVQNKIAQAQRDLGAARDELKASPKTYSIVATPSIHGTLRRPIYIECTEEAIVLQPSGFRIELDELAPPVLPGNPLDTALMTIRDYWIKYNLSGSEGTPYPLLVVRPGGARAYALARRAMENWDDEFGYELVEAEKKLNFGPPDKELQREIDRALKTARYQYPVLRGAAMQIASSRSGGPGGPNDSGGWQASQRGGFIRVDSGNSGDSRASARGTNAAATADGQRVGSLASVSDPQSNTQPDKQARPVDTATSGRRTNDSPESAAGEGSDHGSSGGAKGAIPLAQQRGSNWALPSYHAQATAYKRTIRVYCGHDALIVESRGSGAERLRIPITENSETVADDLVHAVWKQMEWWGIAEKNGYWRPELKFVVMPDGLPVYNMIRQLMNDSGFDIAIEAKR